MAFLQIRIRSFLRRLGFDIVRYGDARSAEQRLADLAKHLNLRSILDVGANIGQFATKLRSVGYEGRIISFEPQKAAYDELCASAAGDKNWIIYARCALGEREGSVELNIAGNSQSSSILPMEEAHVRANPKSAYVATETVSLDTLTNLFARDAELFAGQHVLKMDAQGYERLILAGAEPVMDRFGVIMLEMSLVQLYGGEPSFLSNLGYLESLGFETFALCPGVSDPHSHQMLQVDGIFVKRGLLK